MTIPVLPLFWLAVVIVAVSQVMILRSTVRAMRAAAAASARRGIEWAYAIVPVVALVVVLAATWQATREHAVRAEMETRANLVSPP